MRRYLFAIITSTVVCVIFLFILSTFTFSAECKPGFTYSSKEELESIQAECEKKVNDLRSQVSTLTAQVQFMDTQIYLTSLKIDSTKQKIEDTQKEIGILDEKIEGLDESLNQLSKVLLERIVEGYKTQTVSLLNVFLDSDNANDLINRVKYKKTTQDNNQKLLVQVQESKLNFEEQKKLREKKKNDLDQLKKTLDLQQIELTNQKRAKQSLLEITKNDEKTYQSLLEKARAEYAAIQGIVAGAGTEIKLRDVNKGESIASVISGASCNSSGGHLHFIVQQNKNVTNPFNFLKSADYRNCSGSSCDSGDGDAFNPSGSWDWPLNPLIRMSQGYGETWAVRNTWVGRIYRFHNGLDINGSSNDVTAVADGTLYRGSYAVGCTLSYAKLVHKNSDIETLYLHVYVK